MLKKISLLSVAALMLATLSCNKKEDDEVAPAQGKASLRPSINYNSLTTTTRYSFVDSKGDSTVDRNNGRTRLLMLNELIAYARKGTTQQLDAAVLTNMFANTNSPFVNTSLNASPLQLRNVTGLSSSNPEAVRTTMESYFASIATASADFGSTASQGQAGILTNAAATSKYLVDAKGIEWVQIIAKSMIGAFQIDYIGNTLLGDSLNADNYTIVPGKNYTYQEQVWDKAYGTLTISDRYAANATDVTRDPKESNLGSYVWEYNKTAYPNLHFAFLKGRAAIVNNDQTEVKVQADYIRRQFEIAVAKAALGYLKKWKDYTSAATPDMGAAAHAIGEGAGFIYSLRFCEMHGADAAFSDAVLNDLLLSSTNGFWDLTNAKVVAAETAIKTKFGL